MPVRSGLNIGYRELHHTEVPRPVLAALPLAVPTPAAPSVPLAPNRTSSRGGAATSPAGARSSAIAADENAPRENPDYSSPLLASLFTLRAAFCGEFRGRMVTLRHYRSGSQ